MRKPELKEIGHLPHIRQRRLPAHGSDPGGPHPRVCLRTDSETSFQSLSGHVASCLVDLTGMSCSSPPTQIPLLLPQLSLFPLLLYNICVRLASDATSVFAFG